MECVSERGGWSAEGVDEVLDRMAISVEIGGFFLSRRTWGKRSSRMKSLPILYSLSLRFEIRTRRRSQAEENLTRTGQRRWGVWGPPDWVFNFPSRTRSLMWTCRPTRDSRTSSTVDLVSINEPCSGSPNRIRLPHLWRSNDEELCRYLGLASSKGGETEGWELGAILSEAVESSVTLYWTVEILLVSDRTEEFTCSLRELKFVNTSPKETEFWLTSSETGSRLRGGSLSISLASQNISGREPVLSWTSNAAKISFKMLDYTSPALRHKPSFTKCMFTIIPKCFLTLFLSRDVTTGRDDLLETLIVTFEAVGLDKGKLYLCFCLWKLLWWCHVQLLYW